MQRKTKRSRTTRLTCESLEHRRLMAIDVGVVDGDLLIGGTADGAVSISVMEDGAIQVKEGDNVVATLSDVNDDIRIQLDSAGTVNDQVSLLLEGAEIDRVMVDLGDGDNIVSVESGAIDGSLLFLGGSGNDSLLIAEGVEVEDNIYAWLGQGDNSFQLDGSIGRSLFVRSGSGEDDIDISESGLVGRKVDLHLGDGANSASISGRIEDRLSYRGGDGDDSVEIGESGAIYGSVSIHLGEGANQVTHLGEIEGNLLVVSKSREDVVTIEETAIVGGRVIEQLGNDSRRGGKGIGRFFFR